MNISVKLETITPMRAKMLLETSQRNRTINPSRVKRYATDMRNGNWSPATILIIDEDGHLVDAHHRLHAVMLADISVEMIVVTGLEKRFLPYIDTGRPRSAGDMLRFLEQLDGVNSLKNKATIARIVISTLHGDSKMMVPYDELAAFMLDNIDEINYCHAKYSLIKPIGGTLAVGAAVYFIRKTPHNTAQLETFIDRIAKGEDICSGMPEYAARNAIFSNGRSKNGGIRQSRDLMFLLMAWCDAIHGVNRTFYRSTRIVEHDLIAKLLGDIGYKAAKEG